MKRWAVLAMFAAFLNPTGWLFEPLHGQEISRPPPSLLAPLLGPKPPAVTPKPTLINSRGVGFAINGKGEFVTAFHVVRDCIGLSVLYKDERFDDVDILASDAANDLAVIRVEGLSTPWIPIRVYPPVEALEPLSRLLPGTSTRPYDRLVRRPVRVASLSFGDANDTRVLTLFDPEKRTGKRAFMKGDSGAPIIDASGRLAGILVGVLSAEPAPRSPISDIGFAVVSSLVGLFLNASGITHQPTLMPAEVPRTAIDTLQRDSTLVVRCRRI